jgi:hypothetical protein
LDETESVTVAPEQIIQGRVKGEKGKRVKGKEGRNDGQAFLLSLFPFTPFTL